MVICSVLLFGCKEKTYSPEAPVNDPPTTPADPNPLDGAIAQSTSPTLSWTCNDPNGDSIEYDLYFGTANPPNDLIASKWSSCNYAVTGLLFRTTYYWRVTACDTQGDSAVGRIWRFVTADTVLAGSVVLQSASPQMSNMTFQHSGSEFDTYYTSPPHWKITVLGGYMDFGFAGQHTFKFHALGSTSGGVSYCHVNVIVNGSSFWPDLFVDQNWADYVIPASSFGGGSNTVRIVLTGNTHFWIDLAWIQ